MENQSTQQNFNTDLQSEYNTQRPMMPLPEYGRHMHRLVKHLKSLPTREERTKMAYAMINVMGNLNPHLRDVQDFKHKLWDHLAIMADFELDVDSPYPLPTRETVYEKPQRFTYPDFDIPFKHYGRFISKFIKNTEAIDNPDDKINALKTLANTMKKYYLAWNREAVSDEIIIQDLETISGHKVKLPPDTKLAETRDLLPKNKKTKFHKRN